MKLRIAVYHNVPSGGAKRALFEQTRRLAAVHDIDVYTLSEAEHVFCDLRPFVRKYRVFDFVPLHEAPTPFGLFNHGLRWRDLIRLHPVHKAMAGEVNAAGYDVALIHSDQYTQTPSLLRYLQVPTAYYCHDALRQAYDPAIPRPYRELSGLRLWVDRLNPLRVLYQITLKEEDIRSLRAATRVLVNSYFTRETIYRIYGVSSYVSYLGLDAQEFRPVGAQKGDFLVSVGAVAPHKGFDFLIESLALLPKSKRPSLVIIANQVNKDELHYLKDLASARDVRIEVRSLISDAELVELYNRARLMLYAPILEPFGFVPLESMACGTPVVAVAEGGVRETVCHGETGLLVERDETQFAQAVGLLLDDPELALEMGRRGRRHVQGHWSWEDSVARLESLLEATARQA